ncbi:hypothetical protein AAG570_004749 [Ranatra chinensis]|uniref:Uncharacterized protein n=1 Tax=Ranatra chinensis TaxID=642074 RepID=A0ABD0YED5_9HEMI
MVSKHQNIFHKNKKQETTEIGLCGFMNCKDIEVIVDRASRDIPGRIRDNTEYFRLEGLDLVSIQNPTARFLAENHLCVVPCPVSARPPLFAVLGLGGGAPPCRRRLCPESRPDPPRSQGARPSDPFPPVGPKMATGLFTSC